MGDGERVYAGAGASPGLAVGALRVLRPLTTAGDLVVPTADRDAEVTRAGGALEAAADRLSALARRLAAAGDGAEAEIVEAGAMMARDPLLTTAVEAGIREFGLPAPAALVAAAEAQAAQLAAIDDPMLAARADDVRSVGRRAARIAMDGGAVGQWGRGAAEDPGGGDGPIILVAEDLGPADVAELGDDVCAVALGAGAVTAHAAIVARARGLPMVVAAGASVLEEAQPGAAVVVDGDAGAVVLDPSPTRLADARAAMRARERDRRRALDARDLPALTRDGRRLTVFTNAASAPEVRAGLAAGAEGAGLVRTELAFLDATGWPTEAEHERALAPVLAPLEGRIATVRVLDFGGDKTPPFLRGTTERGIELMLSAPEALEAQLRAILRAGARCRLRVMLPMVESAEQITAVRDVLAALDAEPGALGAESHALGAMIETPAAADASPEIAAATAFLSIGTNDLTHATLGGDRFAAAEAATHDPRVLGAIDRSVRAAHAANLPIEVCGEAASDPALLPLLIGLGVDELSVGAARVGAVREWVRALDHGVCAAVAQDALAARDAAAVAAMTAPFATGLVGGQDAIALAAPR